MTTNALKNMSDEEENREIKSHREGVGNGSKVPHRVKHHQRNTKGSPEVFIKNILDFTMNIEDALTVVKQKPSLDGIQSKLDALTETHELDFICWEAAAKCMKKNKELLSKVRREVQELRTENQQLREFLKASKNEGEKYKSQLENEILRKLLDEF